MNSTFDDESVTEPGVELNEPRFDEEATLLAAQPVVPLVEVKARTRSKARLALAIAVGGGLLIGLLAATFLYRFMATKEAPVAETPVVTEQTKTDEQQNSSGGSTVSAEETAVVTPQEETSPPNETERENAKPAPPKTETAATTPRSRPIIVRESPRRSEPELSDDEILDRDARRAERQEARRERRRAAREARRNRTPTTDDLTRIREIFEGSPRP